MSRVGMVSVHTEPLRRRRILATILVAFALVLVGASGARAAIITSHDNQGRTITFDVRATAVDTDWYAAVLRASAHGNEISNVTIRIVPEPQIEALCGNAAAACYNGFRGDPTIIVPAGKSANLESTLLHEYGHHLDSAWRVPGVQELNGTPAWWAGRGMAALLAGSQVAFDYTRGWDHSVGEIFAEDYSYFMTGKSGRYAIPWLGPPSDALKQAVFAEIGPPQGTLPDAPEVPLVITRNGTLSPRDRYSVPFGLLGPGRRVTLTATVSNPKRKGVRARAQIVCDGRVIANQPFGKGRVKRVLDVPNLGPATCDARLVSTVGIRLTYKLTLQLAVQQL
jgi:predicted thioesterase